VKKPLIIIILIILPLAYIASRSRIENSILPYTLESKKYDAIKSSLIALGDYPEGVKNILESAGFEIISKPNYGLHRYLEMLKNAPNAKTVIYSPGLNEVSERRISSKSIRSFSKNFESYTKTKPSYLSRIRFFIKSLTQDQKKLSKEIKIQSPYDTEQVLAHKDSLLKILAIELRLLFQWSKRNKVHLVLMTQPHLFSIKEDSPCYQLDGKLKKVFKVATDYSKSGKLKKAINLNRQLLAAQKYHSTVNYLQAILYKNNSEPLEAIKYFKKAQDMQCSLHYTQNGFNSVVRQTAHSKKIDLIDIALLVERKIIASNKFVNYKKILKSRKFYISEKIKNLLFSSSI